MGDADFPEAAFPEDESRLSLAELAELSGLSLTLLQELLEAGLLREARLSGAARTFRAESLAAARRAGRLRADFELDDAGTLLALSLLQRIEALEARLRQLECELGKPWQRNL
jgi:chaperone modulatory protein CbpM